MVFVVRQRKDRGGVITVDINVLLPNGERYRERRKAPIQTRTAAAKWAAQREQQILNGYSSGNAKALSLGAFWPEFERIHFATGGRGGPLKPSQCASIRQIWSAYIEPEFGASQIQHITKRDLQDFKSRLIVGRSPKTVANILIVLNTMLDRATQWHEIRTAHAELPRREKPKMEYWSFEESEKLIDASRTVGTHALLIVLLGLKAGMRAGEILALGWDDVDLERGLLCVRRSRWQEHETMTKSGKTRWVPIHQALRDVLQSVPNKKGLVVRSSRRVTYRSLRYVVGRAEQIAGLAPAGVPCGEIHKLRHTFASHLAIKGVDLLKIKELLGHASYTTTLQYAHLSPSTFAAEIAKI